MITNFEKKSVFKSTSQFLQQRKMSCKSDLSSKLTQAAITDQKPDYI